MAYLDQKDITHFLAQELFYQQFLTHEGWNSGVPTKTTPTVTPSIEQTFIELQSNHEPHENEAGFVPPLVHPIGNHQYIPVSESTSNSNSTFTFKQNHWGGSVSQSSSDCDTRSTPPLPKMTTQQTTTTTRRNMGGRKPVKDVSWSPEEEERRRIRRERNKAAAARCRKRRVDHTNALISETEQLEQTKFALQQELDSLCMVRDRLEMALEQHKEMHTCRLHTQSPPDIKPFNNNVYDEITITTERIKSELPFILPPSPTKKVMLSSMAPICKPNRPNSLNVGASVKSVSEAIGIPISTPSNGLNFNFDSMMGGGTGLTPVSTPIPPSCSTQQRNMPVSMADLASPDAGGPPKLVSL